MNNFNNSFLKKATEKTGMTPEQLKNAAKSNDVSEILSHLNKSDAEKIKGILSNKQATDELLNSPQAKSLLQNLFNKK